MFYKAVVVSVVGIAAVLNQTNASAAITPESFVCSRAIEFDASETPLQKSSLVAVPLADDMLRWLNSEFSDLRVFDDQGNQTAARVVTNQSMDATGKKYPLPPAAVEFNFDEKRGETLITLDTKRLPVATIKLDTPDRNFRREVEVLVPLSNSQRERLIMSSEIWRIDLEGLEKEQLSLSFGQTRAPQLQLRIRHGENRPIEIEKVQIFGPSYECRFIAEPGRSYTLAYGSKSIGPDRLDSAALDAAQGRGLKPIQAHLSDKVILHDFIKPDPEADRFLDAILTSPWLIYPAVILLVALLGWGLVHAAKRMPVVDEDDAKDSE